MANPIIHFEIPADDTARAQEFYSSVFGWKITDPWKMDYFLVETKTKDGEGINGGLMKRKMPGQPFANYVHVASIDGMLAKVSAAGGTVAVPKTEIGTNMGWIACFIDTEGNMMGLHEVHPDMARQMKQNRPKRKAAAKKSAKKTAKKKAKKKARRR